MYFTMTNKNIMKYNDRQIEWVIAAATPPYNTKCCDGILRLFRWAFMRQQQPQSVIYGPVQYFHQRRRQAKINTSKSSRHVL